MDAGVNSHDAVSDSLTTTGFLMGRLSLETAAPEVPQLFLRLSRYRVFREIKGQEFAERAVEIAAAGGH
jgi:magnesium chelatase family protein